MSKSDLLGPVIRALVGTPVNRLGIFLDTVQKVSKANAWNQLAQFNKTVVAAAVTTTFVTATYWQTDPSQKLWVSTELTECIVSVFPDPISHRGLEGITHFQSESKDKKNIEKMGGMEEVRKHAFTPDQIADLRDKQVNGEGGQLLTNGYWNLFYVIGKDGVLFVVSLRWRSDDRGWRAHACHLDEDGGWGSGRRVFRNTLELET